VLVTEPTPFGLNDLVLAVEVVRQLEVPFGVIINRHGSGDERVEEYCKSEDIPVLMKIPYDREMAVLYSEGTPFVQRMTYWKDKFRELYDEISSSSSKNISQQSCSGVRC
jgi:MinD superfamily P-loop ATPase